MINTDTLQGLAVLLMALLPVALLWWLWIAMLRR